MDDRQIVPKSARGNQAINPRADRETSTARSTVQVNRFFEDLRAHRRFYNREGEQRFSRQPEGPFVAESLVGLPG
jgi:hypothetical protein